MKKLFVVILVLVLVGSTVIAETLIEDQNNGAEMKEEIKSALEENGTISNYSTVDRITVNANYRTTIDGDYVALIYMTYLGDKGPKYDGSFLLSMSSSIGKIIEEQFQSVNELAVFWELPTYDSQAKASFVLKDGKMAFEDMIWPKVISNAR